MPNDIPDFLANPNIISMAAWLLCLIAATALTMLVIRALTQHRLFCWFCLTVAQILAIIGVLATIVAPVYYHTSIPSSMYRPIFSVVIIGGGILSFCFCIALFLVLDETKKRYSKH